jgi:hypothetical protein
VRTGAVGAGIRLLSESHARAAEIMANRALTEAPRHLTARTVMISMLCQPNAQAIVWAMEHAGRDEPGPARAAGPDPLDSLRESLSAQGGSRRPPPEGIAA